MRKEKTYYVLNVATQCYFDGYFTETSCGWIAYPSCAEEYKTYQRAYAMAKKINNAYGRKICKVHSF